MTYTIKACVLGGVLLGLTGAVSTGASAQGADGLMYITFSRNVALPGTELPAGTYIFEVINQESSSKVVHVASRDRRKHYLLAMTLPVERPANLAPGQVITFGEASPGAAPPIKAWFPDGARVGQQFNYQD
jgi:hypothetical protein